MSGRLLVSMALIILSASIAAAKDKNRQIEDCFTDHEARKQQMSTASQQALVAAANDFNQTSTTDSKWLAKYHLVRSLICASQSVSDCRVSILPQNRGAGVTPTEPPVDPDAPSNPADVPLPCNQTACIAFQKSIWSNISSLASSTSLRAILANEGTHLTQALPRPPAGRPTSALDACRRLFGEAYRAWAEALSDFYSLMMLELDSSDGDQPDLAHRRKYKNQLKSQVNKLGSILEQAKAALPKVTGSVKTCLQELIEYVEALHKDALKYKEKAPC